MADKKFKYRILEKVFGDKSEFHPQASNNGKIWYSLLTGTKNFEHGVSFEKAESIISATKRGNEKPTNEIIHER